MSEGWAPALGNEAGEEVVVEEEDGEDEDEVVEEGVVGGEDDACLPGGDDGKAGHAPGAGEEGHEDQDELHEEGGAGGGDVKPMGKLLEVPADPSWERAVLVVLVHGGEIAPGGVAGEELDEAGLEVDAEPLPEQEEGCGAGCETACAEAGEEAARGEKEGEEAGFEEHAIGLVAGEVLGGGDDREEAEEAEEERGAGPQVENDEGGSGHADPAEGSERGVRSGDPEEGRGVPETGEGAEAVGDRLQVVGCGEDACGTDKAADLEDEREEGGEVDKAEETEEEPAGEELVGSPVRGIEEAAEEVGGRGGRHRRTLERGFLGVRMREVRWGVRGCWMRVMRAAGRRFVMGRLAGAGGLGYPPFGGRGIGRLWLVSQRTRINGFCLS